MAKNKDISPPAAEVKVERKYDLSKLRENCLRLFGVSGGTFDGAVYGKSGEYTIEEIKVALKKWGEREVK